MNDKHLPATLPLHAALSDIADAAGADAIDGTRGTAEVRRLVRRSRRQRATTLSVGGLAVLGLAGIGLSGLVSPGPVEILPAPPVSPTPVSPDPAESPTTCGSSVNLDPNPVMDLAFMFDLRATDETLEIGHEWTGEVGFSGGLPAHTVTLADVRLVATQGLEVVGVVPGAPFSPAATLPMDGSLTLPLTADLVDCGDTSQPLGVGEYEVYAQGTLSGEGGPLTVISRPVALEVVEAGQGGEPPADGEGSEPGLAPTEIRDVIGDDDSAVFDAFRDAAASGAPAAVDLTFVVSSDWQVVEIIERDGMRRLSLPPKAQDLGRARTTSDDGWSVDAHGGALFSDALTSLWPSARLVGTYHVTLDESGERPRFILQATEGGTPATAPPTRDREVCEAIRASVAADAAYPAELAADLRYLLDHPVPQGTSPRHGEIRARWIDSPRVWWAMQIDVATQKPDPAPHSMIAKVC
jgi:hypothetical protein